MRLCFYNDDRLGVVREGQIFDVSSALDRIPARRYVALRADEFIAALPSLREHILREASLAQPIPIDEVSLLAPVANPRKLIAAPVNYLDHQAEAQADPATFTAAQTKRINEIGLFLKAPSALVGCAEGITVGKVDRRTDHEIELAVVIGSQCRNVTAGEALDHVAGYAIGLDITVRGPEERSMRKSLDSYAVLGPYLVTPDEVGDPGSLDLQLEVNGQIRQKANTRDLVINVPDLIALASSWYTLEPGDVIYTGTPAGVGPIEPGDIITASIEKIGAMEIHIS